MRLLPLVGGALLLLGCSPKEEPLRPFAKIDTTIIDESSGLCPSPRYPKIFWTHNDSGGLPQIFAIEKSYPERTRTVRVKGAELMDWEAIAYLEPGRLIIGDFGNNYSLREDLKLYIVREPDPYTQGETLVERVIPFHYEDQASLLGKRNFDCEAMFVRDGAIYLLTKHRSDTLTTLYRIEGDVARVVSSFDVGGKVTDAAYDERLGYVAVLTYERVWLFVLNGKDPDIFTGRAYSHPIDMERCESIAFDDGRLIIGNEEGDLYALPLERIIP